MIQSTDHGVPLTIGHRQANANHFVFGMRGGNAEAVGGYAHTLCRIATYMG